MVALPQFLCIVLKPSDDTSMAPVVSLHWTLPCCSVHADMGVNQMTAEISRLGV